MMQYPLTIDRILARAKRNFPEQEIVSRLADGSIHRYTYGEFYTRTLKLMQVLSIGGGASEVLKDLAAKQMNL